MAHIFDESERTKDVLIDENVSFESLGLPVNILNGLKAGGFRKPSPIQLKAIPLGRCGFDLIIQSKSGTGKTLVFATLALEVVDIAKNLPQVLILAPTREIAAQIQDVIKNLAVDFSGISVQYFIGGLPLEDDKQKLNSCHIAIGAPGRVKHLIDCGAFKTEHIRMLVLDEADKLMEESFQMDINQIFHELPAKKQVIAVSATYPDALDNFISLYMHCPTTVTTSNDTQFLLGLRQYLVVVKTNVNVVQQMRIKNAELTNILKKVPFTQCLIFTNYQNLAESLSNLLNKEGWHTVFISAAQSQTKRLEAVDTLKSFNCSIMVSTDLTARGIDASNVDLVINYGIPGNAMTYLHRMGRAGRYGSKGTCISICNDGKELKELQHILAVVGGTEIAIACLPCGDEFPRDLLNTDYSKFEQVHGCYCDNNEEYSQSAIKTSVFEMKVDTSRQKVKAKHQKKKSKSSLNETNTENKQCSSKNKVVAYKEEKLTAENDDLDILLKSLADGVQSNHESTNEGADVDDSEAKKRKRHPQTSDKNENDMLAKNTALLNVTKLLTAECKSPQDLKANLAFSSADYSHLVRTSNESHTDDDQSAGMLDLENMSASQHDFVDRVDSILECLPPELTIDAQRNAEKQRSERTKKALDNLFSNAFNYACGKSSIHWLEKLPAMEKCKLLQPTGESESLEDEDAEMDIVEDDYQGCFDEDREEELEYDKNQPSSDTCEINYRAETACNAIINESDLKYYKQCFNECCKYLEDIVQHDEPSFETLFRNWQTQLVSVREYVQRNIYISEMSQYQQSKSNQ